MTDCELLDLAIEARKESYSPYSHFAVGAALLCEDGSIITGCNVENGAYGPSNCAERTAFFTAIAQGKRCFEAVAVAGGAEELEICYPCGICRQVMAEFCDGTEFRIICGTNKEDIEVYTLNELFPKSFKLN